MNEDPFTSREKEIFMTLKEIKDCDFVVIGGYAVNTYTLPRFSVDCDIVLADESELRKIGAILRNIGFEKEKLPEDAQYSGRFSRYEKKLENGFTVSVDILIEEVTDRMTGVRFRAGWIFGNSRIRTLKGKTINEELRARIIDIDALLVMKIISCRPTDIRDVFMMLPNAKDKAWVKSEIAVRYDMKDRLNRIIEKVDSRQFKDGLAGVYGQFDQKAFQRHRRAVLSLNA